MKNGDTVTVPFQPTEDQWCGLARDMMMWLDLNQRPTGKSLRKHLQDIGADAPEWLLDEAPDTDHVLAKGTRAALIYKAMLADYKGGDV